MSDITTTHPRIVFFGTPDFAAYIMEFLVNQGENIVVAITTPEKEQGRGLQARASDVQEKAVELGIPVLAPLNLRDEKFITELKSFEADLFCVVAYKILPPEVFQLPKLGAFNIHTSLLPKYRGAAPMNWAIINGEKETGVTTFLLDAKVDTGSILVQKSVGITEDETFGELLEALKYISADIALETIRGLVEGTLHSQPQPNEGVTQAPKLFPSDCILDMSQTAESVHNRIRGLSPSPTAVLLLPDNERLKVYKSRRSADLLHSIPSGEFQMSEDRKHLYVGTGTEPLELLEVQRENKKRMSVEEFLRGAQKLFTK
ncbi:MAG: methionyl-tRNA formyltransferase [bacterium]